MSENTVAALIVIGGLVAIAGCCVGTLIAVLHDGTEKEDKHEEYRDHR